MEIRVISKDVARPFLTKYHYLQDKGFRSEVIYGLYDNNNCLVGVCVFHGVSAPETVVGAFGLDRNNQKGIYELGRLAMHPDLNGGNNTSWFVSRCLKQMKMRGARAIISYADSTAGHIGSIYRALNALYCGVTAKKYDYIDPITGRIKERFKPDEKGTAKNYIRRERGAKHRYVWIYDPTLILKWNVISCNKQGLPKYLSSIK